MKILSSFTQKETFWEKSQCFCPYRKSSMLSGSWGRVNDVRMIIYAVVNKVLISRQHTGLLSHTENTSRHSPSQTSKSLKASSDPESSSSTSPLSVNIMVRSFMSTIHPTTSPDCQERPKCSLPWCQRWACRNTHHSSSVLQWLPSQGTSQ